MTNQKYFLPELPKGWAWTRLSEILSVVKGKKPEKLGAKDEFLTIPYVNIKAFEKKVFSQFTDGNGCTFCEPDDVLIVWDGARFGLVGRGVAGAIGSTLANLVCYELNSAYLFHFLQTKYKYINSRPRGVGIPHVEPGIFWEIDFPLPPLPEQHCIVSKIEELFTKLDAGLEALRKVKAQLGRYRQAVLKYAFEGKLTEEWREAHKGQMESASVLLERIREEENKNKNRRRRGLPPLDTSDLPNLPQEWEWTRLVDLAKVMDVDHKMPKSVEKGVHFISPKDFTDPNGIDFSSSKQISEDDFARLSRKCKPEKGDLLYSRIGTVGKVRKIPPNIRFHISYSLCLIRPVSILQDNDFLYCSLTSSSILGQALDKRRSIGVPDLGLGDIDRFLLPFPPLQEQQRIVEEIERRLSVADEIEKVVEQSLMRAERLRQSILKRAFNGKLVPQDSADEPAEKLLERIMAERARIEAEKKAIGKTRRS